MEDEIIEFCCQKPRNAYSHQQLEEAKKDSPQEPSEGGDPVSTFISDY